MPSSARLAGTLLLGIVAVSLAAVFIRLADAPPLIIASYRMAIATLAFAPLSLAALRRARLSRDALIYTVLAGLCLAGHFATWISSLSYTTVAASVTLVASQPLWVALLSWVFLSVAPTFLVLVGVLLAIAGGALIGFGDFTGGSAPLLGDALALAGAVFGAAYLLLGRAAQRRGLGLSAYAGLAYAVAALSLLPLPAVAGLPYGGYDASSIGWIVLLALIPQLVGHTSFNYAMNYVAPTLVATAMLLEPVGASVFAWLVFGEVPSLTTLVGALILLTGVLFTVQGSRASAWSQTEPAEG